MKFVKFISCLALGSLVVPVAHANLLDDGNFSLATSGGLVSNSAWALTANSPDTVSLAAQFQTGFANAQNTGVGGSEAPGTGAGIWFRSFEGEQGGNTNEPKAQASLTQDAVTTVAGDYQLDFVVGREVNFTAAQFFVSLTGTSDSATIDLLVPVIPDGNIGGAASPNPGGTPFTLFVSGIAAGETLTVDAVMVDGTDSGIPGGQSVFLDSFSLTLVPEPASAALLAVMAGAALLRRRA